MDVRGILTRAPFVKVLSVFIKHLDTMVAAVVDENSSSLRIDSNSVDVIEICWPFLIWRIALFPPILKEFAGFIEFCHACAVVAVRNKHGAVRKPDKKRRSVEVRAIGAIHPRGPDRLDELLTVVRELVDCMHV